jgi:hypothetical protein
MNNVYLAIQMYILLTLPIIDVVIVLVRHAMVFKITIALVVLMDII